MHVAVVVTRSTAARAAATIRSIRASDAHLELRVLSADGNYTPTHGESVTTASQVGLPFGRLALTHEPEELTAALTTWWAATVAETSTEPVLALAPGTVLVGSPARLLGPAEETEAIARIAVPRPADAGQPSLLTTDLFVLGRGAAIHAAELRSLAESWESAERALDLFIARVPHRVHADDSLLVTRWNSDTSTDITAGVGAGLARGGRDVVALDLAGHDRMVPWLFDARDAEATGPLLSRNPALADVVAAVSPGERSSGTDRADAGLVRSIARRALAAGQDLDAASSRLDDWLVELVPAGERSPVARYLAGLRAQRPDLAAVFPFVPGRDSAGLARWALDHGVAEAGYDSDILRRAAQLTLEAQPAWDPVDAPRPHGVNLVGYLAGELGVGTSARLMDEALTAAGIATSTFAVTRDLQSRARASYRRTDPVRYDTTLVAVNADQTPAVVGALDDVVAGTHRIGMWYWEVEAFPDDRAHAFAHVDEIWAATDFVRDSIAARSPVPVRTVLPPLPQRTTGDAPPTPEHIGIPSDRPWFFFAFDFLSTAERKNPWGLVEAFSRAFRPDEGPVLVIKTINARRRAADAERLRILAAARPDVIVVDQYLEQDELTALTARCTAYVSLHRAEGLGLTIAEAMAWGRPVIVSAYSGSMQFTTSSNSYLVPCTPTPIPPDAAPYPAGTPWAEPDLDVAAALLRRVVENSEEAAAVGARAAEDIRVLHSPEAAGRRVRAAVEEIWRGLDEGRRAATAAASSRRTARQAAGRVLRRLSGA